MTHRQTLRSCISFRKTAWIRNSVSQLTSSAWKLYVSCFAACIQITCRVENEK